MQGPRDENRGCRGQFVGDHPRAVCRLDKRSRHSLLIPREPVRDRASLPPPCSQEGEPPPTPWGVGGAWGALLGVFRVT